MPSPGQDSRFRNAKGFDSKLFAIEITPNKVMFIPKGDHGSHYTLHFGVRPGILDVHHTQPNPDGTKRHETLFAMRLSDLEPLRIKLGLSVPERLRGIIRKLRLGWMYHRKIGLVLGSIPTDQQFGGIAKLNKRKRLVLSEQALASNIRVPEFLEQIFNEPDGVFTLVSLKRGRSKQVGFGYKVTLPAGEPRLFWVKKTDILTEMRHIEDQFVQAASHFAIPPECYSQHGI